MNRQAKLFLSLAAVLLMAVFIVWVKRSEKSLPQLRPPPSIPSMTTEAFTKVPDAELLDRIYLECLRRMYAANKGLLAGPRVLSEPACNLWVIAMLEDRLRTEGFRAVLRSDRQTGSTPLSPSLEQLRDAYLGLGQALPADLLQDALAKPDDANEDQDPYALLNSKFLKWLGSGTRSLRLAYAKEHLKTLFPEGTTPP